MRPFLLRGAARQVAREVSTRCDDARRGVIEAARGNTALARQLFSQVENGYSNSPEAMLARQELEKLSG